MGLRYVTPETPEHALELLHAGLLYMNQDTSCERDTPIWQRAAKFIQHYIPEMYAEGWAPTEPTEYIKSDIAYVLED